MVRSSAAHFEHRPSQRGTVRSGANERMARMAIVAEALAEGAVATWAGVVRVSASAAGVREVWLPNWHDRATAGSTQPGELADAAARVRRQGDEAAEAKLRAALDELAEYFAGERRSFTVALDLRGPAFFRRVWEEVGRVPYGETRSYAEIARAVGEPRATRAVGAANGANPVAPLVPCHRVVGSDGRLTGYGPGLPLKERLLVMEDAMPDGEAAYADWSGRVAARMGVGRIYIGVRGTGVYCLAGCPGSVSRRARPGRVFRTAEEAAAAGFRPCAVCRPDVQA
jgi:O-6-methylguanine DNA methyltransferase